LKAIAGESFTHTFSFTQEDVIAFANVTGDDNPVHLDEGFAAQTPFRKPIMHGFLSGSVFSRVFGTVFPGPGSIYLSQEMNFRRPMYVGQEYLASFTLAETDPAKGLLVFQCRIVDTNGKVCLEGMAKLMNKAVFTD
jgi:acyl dehydratase